MVRISESLSLRAAVGLWRERIMHLRELSQFVGLFQERRDSFSLLRVLDRWKHQLELKVNERTVTRVLDQKRLGSSWDAWKRAA